MKVTGAFHIFDRLKDVTVLGICAHEVTAVRAVAVSARIAGLLPHGVASSN